MPNPSPYLFILKNGPVYGLDDYVAYQIQTLSEGFAGELWVDGSFNASKTIGRFQANVVLEEDGGSRLAFKYHYFRKLLARARIVDREVSGPKVVITYDPFLNGLMGHLISRALGWPLIVEVNGAFANPDNYADSFGFFARTFKPALSRLIGRFVIGRAHGVRLLFKEQLQGFASTNPSCVVRQYFDAVPLDRFAPGPEERFLLHVGFPYRRKGVDLLLEAFARVGGEFPDWKLVLIGHELQDHIPVNPPNVVVMKPMPNAELATWISRCAALVLASRSEAMGRVLIEAAAAAKPRIVSKVDGTYTVVNHDSDGLLFEAGNVEALATALRSIMRDESLRRRLGDTARTRALTEFGAASYLGHVSSLVGAVLAAHGPRS
ncbi:MAG TPA: glycosyltransferase family 4 protein [Steroidobacter sp.]|uniref:glycosyltransferase family 4 protein n=1 Tax=Steroidobacter sp. TaxID=1978227 RepID=UPI002ED97833